MTTTDHTDQATAHTPEPWGDNQNGIILGNLDEYIGVAPTVAVVEGYDEDGNANDKATANTRRICAAVNACMGVTTEALEQGAISELLEALKGCLFALDTNLDGYGPSKAQAIAAATTAIAKATGRAI